MKQFCSHVVFSSKILSQTFFSKSWQKFTWKTVKTLSGKMCSLTFLAVSVPEISHKELARYRTVDPNNRYSVEILPVHQILTLLTAFQSFFPFIFHSVIIIRPIIITNIRENNNKIFIYTNLKPIHRRQIQYNDSLSAYFYWLVYWQTQINRTKNTHKWIDIVQGNRKKQNISNKIITDTLLSH